MDSPVFAVGLPRTFSALRPLASLDCAVDNVGRRIDDAASVPPVHGYGIINQVSQLIASLLFAKEPFCVSAPVC